MIIITMSGGHTDRRRSAKTINLRLISPEILENGEIPLLETRPFVLGYIAKPLLLLIVGVILSATPLGPLIVILAIPWLVYRLLKWRSVVTDRRVIVKRGILGLDYEDASLTKINNVFLKQGVLGRLLGYGTRPGCRLSTSKASEIQRWC